MRSLHVKPVKLGIERLLDGEADSLAGARAGLICNQASVDHGFRHSADLLSSRDEVKLEVLFGPQHGIRGDVQDNMIETGHSNDPSTGLKVFSLYSETREPAKEMLDGLDVLLFDLQDIGGRVYTFIYTMANAMKACAEQGVRFVVCDRPNPVGGLDVEGALLEKGHESFVGQFPIPMRHGMTVGELALMFNSEFAIDCDLDVIEMLSWSRQDYYDETDAPWVMPSPNIPTVDSAVVFTSTVYFEGTKVSEGRGTTRPFELVGAPYIRAHEFAAELNALELDGVYFRATDFVPTFQKHAGTCCGGVFIHIIDRRTYRPVKTGIAMIETIIRMYPDEFEWKEPPYEYEFERNPFDVIAGTERLRRDLEEGASHREIAASWETDETDFRKQRKPYLLYGGE